MPYPTIASLISREILFRAFLVALVLGSILTLANQPDVIFGSAAVQVLPLVLVYLTPFIVVTVSQVLAVHRATLDARLGYGRNPQEHGFFVTAMSHGIPFRALAVAVTIGATNTAITAVATLASSGTISDLPVAIITQAFALPVLFGLVSQTISYRRASAAMVHQLQPALLSPISSQAAFNTRSASLE